MALTRGFTQNSGTTPLDTRLMFMALLRRNTDGSPRLGVLYGSTSPVSGTTSMNVTLTDNVAFVTSRGTTDGINIVSNIGGTVSLTLDAAPSANSRIDVVWIKQNDGGTGGQGDADSLPTFGKTTGTAAASPAVPSIPSGALALAQVRIPANAASTTDTGVVITNVVTNAGLLSGDVFALTESSGQKASNTSLGTLGGVPTQYVTSDASVLPKRTTDAQIGPIAVPGWYEVTANTTWDAQTGGQRFIEITRNDTELTPHAGDLRDAASFGRTIQAASTYVLCAAGDMIRLRGWQSSGGGLAYTMRLTARLARAN